MADIYHADITITLKGAEWFAVMVALQYGKRPSRLLSKEGKASLLRSRRHLQIEMLRQRYVKAEMLRQSNSVCGEERDSQ